MVEVRRSTGPGSAFRQGVHVKLVKEAASRRNVSIENISPRAFTLSKSQREVLFYDHMPSIMPMTSRMISGDKHLTKIFLNRAGIVTPSGQLFRRQQFSEALQHARMLTFPVVVKPVSGSSGIGVTSNISDEEHFRSAWEFARSPSIVVEKHVVGNDHRMLVIGGRFICAIHRVPASVTGDGMSDVLGLIAAKNRARMSNPYVSMKKFVLTGEMSRTLEKRGLSAESVLPEGERIELHPVANIATGGESVDVTDDVHPDFARIAESAAGAIPDCFMVGVDLLVPDISQPAEGQGYAVIELNTNPDIAMHHFPIIGQPRDAAGALVETLFPRAKPVTPARSERLLVTLRGPVIGVGMRARIEKMATLNAVTGWVKNRGNEVDAALCGSNSAVARMLDILCQIKGVELSTEKLEERAPEAFTIIR